MNTIKEFKGAYFFLSNFYEAPIEYDGIMYPSSEHAFQAQKTSSVYRQVFAECESPSDAKHLGRSCKLRIDWEEVKDDVMYGICLAKFTQHPHLAERLLATEDAYLEEGNHWNDTYWGICRGVGKNKLGIILMRIREEIKNEVIQQ